MADLKFVILSAVGFLLATMLVPLGMNEITATNMTGWQPAVSTIYTILLPILFIVGVAIGFIKTDSRRKS